jgi:hypothetical protein
MPQSQLCLDGGVLQVNPRAGVFASLSKITMMLPHMAVNFG